MNSSGEEGQDHSRPLDPLCSAGRQTTQILLMASWIGRHRMSLGA